jgi:transposase
MNRQPKYPPELRERAIRMVYEQREHHESQWAAIESVAQKIGCTAQTLRNWIAKTEGKAGADEAASAPRVKALEREVRELKRPAFIATVLCTKMQPFSPAGMPIGSTLDGLVLPHQSNTFRFMLILLWKKLTSGVWSDSA